MAFFSPYDINKNISWYSSLAVGVMDTSNNEDVYMLFAKIPPRTPERDGMLAVSLSSAFVFSNCLILHE